MFTEPLDPKRAAKLCGFRTVAMLDYLERTGVFVRSQPKRRGKKRKYDFRDLLVLKVIKALLDHGASVSSLKKALSEFQHWKWKAEPTVLEDKNGGLKYFIASGDRFYLAHNTDVLVDLSNRGQLAFSFILDLDRLHRELCGDIGLPRHAELQLTA
jgi:DNA-binding transcriptional MerR regulator